MNAHLLPRWGRRAADRLGLWMGALMGAALLSCAAPAALAQAASGTPAAFNASEGAAPPASPLPVELFARLPLLSTVVLSPNGERVAALMNHDDRTLVVTRPVAGQDLKSILSTDNKEFRIAWIRWVSDERLLVSVVFASRRDFVGTIETRLLSIKADGSGLINLVRNPPRSGSMTAGQRTQQIQDRVVDWLPGDGRHVLLALPEPESVLPSVFKVNVDTGERRGVKAPERDVYQWVTDAQHRVRVGIRKHERVTEVRISDPDGKNWRTAWRYETLADGVFPLGFGIDPQELYVHAYHQGRLALFSVRLDDPALPRTLRLAHPRYDVGGALVRSPLTGEVIGVQTDGDDETESRLDLWDTAWRDQAKAIDQALPGRRNFLTAISRDEQRYLVYSSGNGKPPLYYLGDRRTGELAEIGGTYPELESAGLAGKQVADIVSRDGLPLQAFVTLPGGRRLADAGTRLPLVLLPHGGPMSNDDADFDVWTELLANRGYAVLQVNFRGSWGYGAEFADAGLRRWGLEMQDDLTDAVKWAVDRGLADAGRICIVGGSYGGYAALMGVVKTPDLYRCAVSFAGVSDLPELIGHESQYVGGRDNAEKQIGRAWSDREQLRATSPARQAARIQVPVLLAHGTSDRVVPVDQSEMMASALKSAGKPHRYLELEGGDHHLSRYTHRLQFFKAMEAFLAENLTPRAGGGAVGAAAGR